MTLGLMSIDLDLKSAYTSNMVMAESNGILGELLFLHVVKWLEERTRGQTRPSNFIQDYYALRWDNTVTPLAKFLSVYLLAASKAGIVLLKTPQDPGVSHVRINRPRAYNYPN